MKVSKTAMMITVAVAAAALGFGGASAATDDVAPDTILTKLAPPTRVGLPGSGIGTFEGTSIDADTSLYRLQAVVQNPIGRTKIYEIRKLEDGNWQEPRNGFQVISQTPDGKTWNWRWISPTPDIHFAFPGTYRVSFLAADYVLDPELNNGKGNQELPDDQNKATVSFIL